MITKLTSIKTVIAKIIADLDLKEDDIRISDVRSWCGEAIEKIGAVTQFIPKVSGQDGTPITKLDIKHRYHVIFINYIKLHTLLIVMDLGFL